jgi:hypothetical protein
MTLRARLHATALLGTAQHPLDFPPVDFTAGGSPLDEALARVGSTGAAQRFLESAALLVAYERAGATPSPAPPLSPAAEEDSRSRCSRKAAGYLAAVLAERRALLPEWLSLALAAGVRPPEESLPALLEAGTGAWALRDPVRRAGGPLAKWLAASHPDWLWVGAVAEDESAWETGTIEERVAFFTRLRASNPARARELLQGVWAAEPADSRRRFLEAMNAGRSVEDEPFLEAALDDRSAVVRRVAAEHLARFAPSRLCERMKARLEGRIRIARSGFLGRKAVIEVEPFEDVDAAMARDAIEKKPPAGSQFGARAWWTMQAIAAVHPSYWAGLFERSAPELIEAAKNGQWADLLLGGWQSAAIRYRALDWLEALLDQFAEPGTWPTDLLLAMPGAARERAMLRKYDADGAKWLLATAACCPHAWSAEFTARFLEILERYPAQETMQYQYRELLRAGSLLASSDVQLPPPDALFERTLVEFFDTLSFRRRMRDAFTPRT